MGRIESRDTFSEVSEFTRIAGRDGKPGVRVLLTELTYTIDDGTMLTERIVLYND